MTTTTRMMMMMMMSTQYQTNKLSQIFIVLSHRNNSPRVGMSYHSDTLSLFRTNYSLISLFITACKAENQTNTNLIVFGVTQPQNSTQQSTTLEASTIDTTDAVSMSIPLCVGIKNQLCNKIGTVAAVVVWQLDLQLTTQSVPITTNVRIPLMRGILDTTSCDKVYQ